MRTFDTAHQAAMAHAGAHKARVGNCLTYADRLIRQRAIRPVVNGNRQIKHWIIVGPKDWWILYAPMEGETEIKAGPFATKREALEWADAKTSKKRGNGCYLLRLGRTQGVMWTLFAVTTEYAVRQGLDP